MAVAVASAVAITAGLTTVTSTASLCCCLFESSIATADCLSKVFTSTSPSSSSSLMKSPVAGCLPMVCPCTNAATPFTPFKPLCFPTPSLLCACPSSRILALAFGAACVVCVGFSGHSFFLCGPPQLLQAISPAFSGQCWAKWSLPQTAQDFGVLETGPLRFAVAFLPSKVSKRSLSARVPGRSNGEAANLKVLFASRNTLAFMAFSPPAAAALAAAATLAGPPSDDNWW
mmetsp:Transcript_32082/g.80706  ORF Transcript_32082/g.80706 Transcript_32082/m.80706 type:complete len:230 (+) Transcript_32082:931-1620(+)